MIPSLIRVQPVEPDKPSGEVVAQEFFGTLLAGLIILPLTGLFLWLALGTLHDLFPAVPAVGYWQSVSLLLGLNVLKSGLTAKPFKWARR